MGFNILNKACFNWFFKPVVSLTFSFSTGLNRDLHRIGTARDGYTVDILEVLFLEKINDAFYC